jgi:hypothetical protein
MIGVLPATKMPTVHSREAPVSALEDFGFDARAADADFLNKWLDLRIDQLMSEVRTSLVWSRVMSDVESIDDVTGILAQIYLEIAMYQPDAIEAAVASIAQFPRKTPVAIIDEMLQHQVEEFDHVKWRFAIAFRLAGMRGKFVSADNHRPLLPSLPYGVILLISEIRSRISARYIYLMR